MADFAMTAMWPRKSPRSYEVEVRIHFNYSPGRPALIDHNRGILPPESSDVHPIRFDIMSDEGNWRTPTPKENGELFSWANSDDSLFESLINHAEENLS